MTMKQYIVGGYVRDTLMGVKSNDVDYVMTGVTPVILAELEYRGYKQVGADFPVLLHPFSGDEYALARVERKVGIGYLGFECSTENVTLEQDLARRDLTINAMAIDESDNITIIDPFGGQEDIKNRILRHVSPAFAEDPVRILRTARFAARFRFNVADETILLMQDMVKAGEVDALQRERVVAEITKAAEQATKASMFIRVLVHTNAWPILFPEIEVPDLEHMYHIDKAVCFAPVGHKFTAFMAMLLRDTPDEQLQALQARLVLPSVVFRFARRYALYSKSLCVTHKATAREIVAVFDNMNILNNGKAKTLQQMIDLLCVECVMNHTIETAILEAFDAYSDIDVATGLAAWQDITGSVAKGDEIRAIVNNLRVASVNNLIHKD